MIRDWSNVGSGGAGGRIPMVIGCQLLLLPLRLVQNCSNVSLWQLSSRDFNYVGANSTTNKFFLCLIFNQAISLKLGVSANGNFPRDHLTVGKSGQR